MNLSKIEVSFNKNFIYEFTLDFFKSEIIKHADEVPKDCTDPIRYRLYDKYIITPILSINGFKDKDYDDFIEAVAMMSWAIYRNWKYIDPKKLEVLFLIEKNKVISDFMDNINCDESEDLYDKITRADDNN